MISSALLLLFAAGVLLCVGRWTREDALLRRGATLLMLAILLLGMLLPADGIDVLRDAMLAMLGSSLPTVPGPSVAIWAHLVLFAFTGLLLGRLRHHFGWVRVLAFLLVLAVMTEVMQFFSPGRYPSWFDVGTNVLGISVGLTLMAAAMGLGTRLGMVLRSSPKAERIGQG